VRYAREFVTQFGADNDQLLLGNFLRAEAESLWNLGDHPAAEERFESLTQRYPDLVWGYIGWGDCYWLGPYPTSEPRDGAKDYARGEAIYRRALERPMLDDRVALLDRLGDLYADRGDVEQATAWREQAVKEASRLRGAPALSALVPRNRQIPVGAGVKLGRNDPCWCGSGRKYKRCHLDADAGRT
jgi:tetratricopeptide (TPR) repeat protein